MIRIPITLFLLTASLSAFAQWATEYRSVEVVPGIYMIDGADGFSGGNIALLIGNDYVALIDDGTTTLAPKLLEVVADIAARPVDFVINTHVHGDHVGGNMLFAGEDAIVFAHDNIRKRLLPDPASAGGDGGLPVVTFGDAVTFHLNGIEAYVFHIEAAHTDGDAAIHFPGINVIHTGDLWFHKLFPFVDLDSGGDVGGFIAGQQRIIEMADDDTIIIPGHGAIGSKADLEEDLAVLVDSRARVKALVDQGRDIDEILAANPLSVYHDRYDWMFITTERMTRMLHRDLTSGD